jgi:hypothetical protein
MLVLTLPRYGQTVISHNVHCSCPLPFLGLLPVLLDGEDGIEDGRAIMLDRYYVSVLEVWRIDNLEGTQVRKILERQESRYTPLLHYKQL